MQTKKGYWVVAYRSVSDPAALAEYGKMAGPVIMGQGGKPLVRTNEGIYAVEAGLAFRTVVFEFESFAAAKAVYESEEYKAALKILGSAAERDFRIVEGVD